MTSPTSEALSKWKIRKRNALKDTNMKIFGEKPDQNNQGAIWEIKKCKVREKNYNESN